MMNNKSLDTIRSYVEFNAIANPKLNFINCPHTNKNISNEKLKVNFLYRKEKYNLKISLKRQI